MKKSVTYVELVLKIMQEFISGTGGVLIYFVVAASLALVSENTEKGNVIPGLTIAVLGVVANTIFWRKYAHLNKVEPNEILAVQARLYRAKSLVDTCVTIALLSVEIAPKSEISYYLDLIGSAIVAIYLVICGVQTIWERVRGRKDGVL